jgi:hypothetical protein
MAAMLRSVILMAGFILVAVLMIAPSLPTDDQLAARPQAGDDGAFASESAPPAATEPVARVFATDDGGKSSGGAAAPQPERPATRAPDREGLVALPTSDSVDPRAARAPEY